MLKKRGVKHLELEYLSENPSITYDKLLLLVEAEDSINDKVEELH